MLRRWPLPPAHATKSKDERGCTLVVGGSESVPGAVMLAALAALRAGAGKLQIATARRVAPWVAVTVPEARVIGLRQTPRGELHLNACRALDAEIAACDALLLGPGMMDGRAAIPVLRARAAAPSRGPALVVDAGALAAFAGRDDLARRFRPPAVITPHAGEMAQLWGVPRDAVERHPAGLARQAAERLGVVVVLKGAITHLAAPGGGGLCFHNDAGNSGLGTSGSGDVLAGIIAGLCARGADPLQAAVWGVFIHSKAGEALARRIGPVGYLARELIPEIPTLLDRFARPP